MGFRTRIKYFLVHTLGYTGKDADKIIASGTLSINGNIIVQNEPVKDEDELRMNGAVIRPKPDFRYYALNKPAGIECSFSKKIKDNLSTVFPFDGTYFIAGRLDKASEGLVLISNDGKWVDRIANAKSHKEKEYEVAVDKPIDAAFIEKMSGSVDIGFHLTRPCVVKQLSGTQFSIVLTEGKNRQIRRMCKSLGYAVIELKRVRIDKFYLSDLQNLDYKIISPGLILL
ncbi:MAG: pseudouridine synthase [Bacteroidia bacterium]